VWRLAPSVVGVVGVVTCASACGRIGFDAVGDGRGSGSGPMNVDASTTGSDGAGVGAMVVAASAGFQPNATSVSANVAPTTAGDTLVIGTYGENDVVSVDDDKLDVFHSANARATSSNGQTDIWYAIGVAADVTSVTVHYTSMTSPSAWIVEVANVAALGATHVKDDGSISTVVLAPEITVGGAGVFIFCVEAGDGTVDNIVTGQGFTAMVNENGDDAAYLVSTEGGSFGAVWNDSSTGAFSASSASFTP
jgi:hypothetical protein